MIEQIIKQIIGDPRLRELLNQAFQAAPPPVPEPPVLVVLATPIATEVLATARESAGACNPQVVATPEIRAQVTLPAGMAWLEPAAAYERTDWSKILVPVCPPGLLAKIALGLRDDLAADLLGRGLMSGCAVEILSLGLDCDSRTPAAYRDLYAGYTAKLLSYGVAIRDLPEGLVANGSAPPCEPVGNVPPGAGLKAQNCSARNREPAVMRFDKKLLAERDALGFPEDSVVEVNGRTVISPLAHDVLRLRRVTLRRERG